MRAAYVDSSCLVSVALAEPDHERVAAHLETYDTLLSSHLLEAELRAAFAREELEQRDCDPLLGTVRAVLPTRPLREEMLRVLELGYTRGADLLHLATALFLAPSGDLPFLTLDIRQQELAGELGFPTEF